MNSICDIIVLTWNKLNITRKFIASFLNKTKVSSRLIIIDNGSKDGTVEYLEGLTGNDTIEIKTIFNNENKGFIYGVNQGIAISNAPYICLANNDLIFTEGWIEEIISVFENNKQIGLLNPNSNNLGTKVPDGENIDIFGKSIRKKHKGEFIEMPFCIGFCMVIKKEVIKKVGGMSEEFQPMFFEDTYYSMKVSKAGYLIGMAKGSYVWHQEHASFSNMKKQEENIFLKSKKTFLNKWGKILRIAWVLEDYNQLINNLDKAVFLARQGNFVWVFIKNLNKNKSEIFREKNLTEHSGVNFIKYNNTFDLLYKIIKKKKRYMPVISSKKFVNFFLKLFNFTVISAYDEETIKKIKFS